MNEKVMGIKIKVSSDTKGADDAKQSLWGLVDAADKVEAKGKTASRSIGDLGNASATSDDRLRKFSAAGSGAQQVLTGIETAATGGRGALLGMAGAVRGIIAAITAGTGPIGLLLATLGTIGGLFFAFGDKLFGAKKKVEDAGAAADKTREKFSALGRVEMSMARQRDEIDALRKGFDRAADAARTLRQSQDELADAQLALRLQEVDLDESQALAATDDPLAQEQIKLDATRQREALRLEREREKVQEEVAARRDELAAIQAQRAAETSTLSGAIAGTREVVDRAGSARARLRTGGVLSDQERAMKEEEEAARLDAEARAAFAEEQQVYGPRARSLEAIRRQTLGEDRYSRRAEIATSADLARRQIASGSETFRSAGPEMEAAVAAAVRAATAAATTDPAELARRGVELQRVQQLAADLQQIEDLSAAAKSAEESLDTLSKAFRDKEQELRIREATTQTAIQTQTVRAATVETQSRTALSTRAREQTALDQRVQQKQAPQAEPSGMSEAEIEAELVRRRKGPRPPTPPAPPGISRSEWRKQFLDDYLSGADLPRRAQGGPVRKGEAYVVGEERPEVFVPDENGTILPDASNPIMIDGRAFTEPAAGKIFVGGQEYTPPEVPETQPRESAPGTIEVNGRAYDPPEVPETPIRDGFGGYVAPAALAESSESSGGEGSIAPNSRTTANEASAPTSGRVRGRSDGIIRSNAQALAASGRRDSTPIRSNAEALARGGSRVDPVRSNGEALALNEIAGQVARFQQAASTMAAVAERNQAATSDALSEIRSLFRQQTKALVRLSEERGGVIR